MIDKGVGHRVLGLEQVLLGVQDTRVLVRPACWKGIWGRYPLVQKRASSPFTHPSDQRPGFRSTPSPPPRLRLRYTWKKTSIRGATR